MSDGPPPMDPDRELREAHDLLAEVYAAHLHDLHERIPEDAAVLGLFIDRVKHSPHGTVLDVGCGTGRLAPLLSSAGLEYRGIDLSPGMVEVAGRDHPAHRFEVADVRALSIPDGACGGVVCWYSLMYLAPAARAVAYQELARVLAPGGHLVVAYKQGDGRHRRAGRPLGVEFDIYWQPEREITESLRQAGLTVSFAATRAARRDEAQPQGYLIAHRSSPPLPPRSWPGGSRRAVRGRRE